MMNRLRCVAVALLSTLAACGGASHGGGVASQQVTPILTTQTPPPGPSTKIRHVVIIFQENRSVDDLFNGLPGADTVRSGVNSKGQKVDLQPIDLSAPYDLGHKHSDFTLEYDGGKLDGFDRDNSTCQGVTICISRGLRAYGYVPQDEVKPYFIMAERYTFGDRMFQTNQGPSFPAHQYIISGTSTIADGSALRAADNPVSPQPGNSGGGCDSAPGSLVFLIDAAGNVGHTAFPCFRRLSLMELLDRKSLTWRY
jgi:phospholipase C